MIRLDIFSDPVCPWCLIGKTYLDRALESRPNHPFQIAWHPFQLNPEMPTDGVAKRAYLEEKFGGKARVPLTVRTNVGGGNRAAAGQRDQGKNSADVAIALLHDFAPDRRTGGVAQLGPAGG